MRLAIPREQLTDCKLPALCSLLALERSACPRVARLARDAIDRFEAARMDVTCDRILQEMEAERDS